MCSKTTVMEWQRLGRKPGISSMQCDFFPYGGMQVKDKEKISSFYFSKFPDRSRDVGFIQAVWMRGRYCGDCHSIKA